MNPTTRSKIIVTAMLAGLTSIASAQSVTGTVNSATQGAASVMTTPPPAPAATPPAPPATPPPPAVAPPSAGVNAGAAAQGSATTVVSPPLAPPAHANSAATTNSAVSGSTTGVNANATTRASTTGQTRGLSVATEASRQASVTVNTADTVALIKQSAFSIRDSVTSEVQSRVDASARVVADLEARAEQGGERSRAAVAKALVDVRAREKALRSSLREAAKASKESSWGEIQSVLAKDYGAYAQAVASAEAAADASAQ